MANFFLDCKGKSCPVPIIEMARKCKELEIGDTLEVESDDPAFVPDVEAWVESMDYKLLTLTGTSIKRAVVQKTK